MAAKAAKRSTAARKAKKRSTPKRKTAAPSRKATRRWSQHVTETSDAMDLRHGVFKLADPKKIAAFLKRSAEASHRRKANPYRSALSMLTFYINRGGKGLSASRRKVLERAKDELRALFDKG